MIMFEQFTGDLRGLPTSKNHLNFRWLDPDCRILFSVCQMGEAASCHFCSDKKGLRRLREAINQFVEFVFVLFDWCKMVIAKVVRKSVGKLLLGCGFLRICSVDGVDIFGRWL